MRAESGSRCAWLGAIVGSLCAFPALANDPGPCATIRDEAARASCVAVGRRAEIAGSAPASVRALVRPWDPASAEAVDARALARAPDRYVGRVLLLRGRACRYADVNRYVCTLAGTPRFEIHAAVVMPPPAQVAIEAGIACPDRRASPRQPGCEIAIRAAPTAATVAGDGTTVMTAAAIWVGRSIGRRRSR